MNIVCDEIKEMFRHHNPYIELLYVWIQYGEQADVFHDIVYGFRSDSFRSDNMCRGWTHSEICDLLRLNLTKETYMRRIFKPHSCCTIRGGYKDHGCLTNECKEWLMDYFATSSGIQSIALISMGLCEEDVNDSSIWTIDLLKYAFDKDCEEKIKSRMEECFEIIKKIGVIVVKDCHGECWDNISGYIDDYALRIGYECALENKLFYYIKVGG